MQGTAFLREMVVKITSSVHPKIEAVYVLSSVLMPTCSNVNTSGQILRRGNKQLIELEWPYFFMQIFLKIHDCSVFYLVAFFYS